MFTTEELENEIREGIEWADWVYMVSNLWRIKNTTTNRLLKIQMQKWYTAIWLYLKSWYTRIKIHRLVAKAFIPNPEDKEVVNHINFKKDDNRVENLDRVSYQENSDHYMKYKYVEPIPQPSNKPVRQYTLDWEFIQERDNIEEATWDIR